MKNRKIGGELVYDLHPYSLKIAFAMFPAEQLKSIAQKLREQLDWNFDKEVKTKYDNIMEVIRISEPNFETEFVPAQ